MADNEKQEAQLPADDDKAKDKAPAKVKKEKVSIFKRLGKFFRECRGELKKIVWYSREQTFHSSVLVIVCIIIVSAVVAGFDLMFSKGLQWLASLV